jgi:ADP-ribose pyrophosphatase YjhB (NUDIX family)
MEDSAVNARGQTLEAFLKEYDPACFERPSVTVDVVLFTLLEGDPPRLGVMMIRRKDHPFINKWAVPGGFVNMDENLMTAAYRELEEETGITDVVLKDLAPFSEPDRDPRTRIITFAYYGMMPMGTLKPKAGDDAAEARVFAVETTRKRSGGAVMTTLELQNEELHLRALLKTQSEYRGRVLRASTRIVDPGEIAGDHALILGSALRKLRALPPKKALLPLLPPLFSRRMYVEAFGTIYGPGQMVE